MNSIERIKKCFNFQEADRVPIDLDSFWVTTILHSTYAKLIKKFGLDIEPRLNNINHQNCYI